MGVLGGPGQVTWASGPLRTSQNMDPGEPWRSEWTLPSQWFTSDGEDMAGGWGTGKLRSLYTPVCLLLQLSRMEGGAEMQLKCCRVGAGVCLSENEQRGSVSHGLQDQLEVAR